jgi:hypothetical protein
MQLTKEQIDQLFEFTRKKYVRWYDLQIEIVDHLASRIEEEMEKNAALSFEQALEQVYKGFGIFGFSQIVREKEAQLEKAASRLWLKTLTEYFTVPKIAFSAFIIALSIVLAYQINSVYLQVFFVAAYITGNIVLGRKLSSLNKTKKKLLMLQYHPFFGSTFVFLYQLTIFSKIDTLNPVFFCVTSVIGTMILVVSFEVYYILKRKAIDQYPEAFEIA